jgi:omega-amidase
MNLNTGGSLTVALVSEVFWQPDGGARLTQRLAESVERGAQLVVLPEIALNPWRPSTKVAVDEDAEPMNGRRVQLLLAAAREARIGLVGGIIHRDAATGRRTSRTLVFDATGALVATYEKLHLPEEPGFWETSHYEPGEAAPRRIDAFGMPIGVQVCSDTMRPEGSHLLGAQGAEAILIPRATELATYRYWHRVFQANARTSACYVLSVNRPDAEDGVLIGGPSIAIDPFGEIMVETTDPVAVVTLKSSVVREARVAYPGYLPIRARLYADAWAEIAGRDGEPG